MQAALFRCAATSECWASSFNSAQRYNPPSSQSHTLAQVPPTFTLVYKVVMCQNQGLDPRTQRCLVFQAMVQYCGDQRSSTTHLRASMAKESQALAQVPLTFTLVYKVVLCQTQGLDPRTQHCQVFQAMGE